MKELKKFKITLTVLFLFGLLLCSCSLDNLKKHKKKIPVKSIVILVDGSTSYSDHYLEFAKKEIINILKSINTASIIYIRWISENSIQDASNIYSHTFNYINKPERLDIKNYKKYNYLIVQNLEEKKKAINIIQKLNNPSFEMTDLIGGLLIASDRFDQSPDNSHEIIIFSDLDDNVKIPETITFKNTLINVYYPVTDNSDRKRQKEYETYFKKTGADVHFYYNDHN